MDADLATDLGDLPALVDALDTADVAIGSRVLQESTVDGATTARARMGRMFNQVARATPKATTSHSRAVISRKIRSDIDHQVQLSTTDLIIIS